MEASQVNLSRRPFWTRQRKVWLVVVVGLLLRAWAAWQLPVDFDEPVYLQAGYEYAGLMRAGDWQGVIDYPENSEHPPLVKLIYGGVVLAAGPRASWEAVLLAGRLVSVVFGTLAVALVALVDPLAGGLLAVQTLVVKYTSQAYLEALPLAMALLALFALRRSQKERDAWFWLSAAALGLTAAGKYSYFPILLVVLYVALVDKRFRIGKLLLYLGTAGLAFVAFNPALWSAPLERFADTFAFHVQYSQSAHVQESGYPWYQPFLWISRSHGYNWHSEVFFYFGFDGLIFLFAVAGMWLERRRLGWVLAWAAGSLLFLLLWPTKWPQYTLVLLPALCLLAAGALRRLYALYHEQEAYWDWLNTMFPKPSRKYMIAGGIVLGLLTLAIIVNNALLAANRIGWSTITARTAPLPSDTIYDLLPLPDGRMALASERGLVLWEAARDGDVSDRWQVFDTENSPLPAERVLALALDGQARLWMGTAAGLAVYDGQHWAVYHKDDFGLLSEQVNAVAVDSAGRVWIGTQIGAAVLDGTTWTPYTASAQALVDNAVFSLAVEPAGDGERIWFGTLWGVSVYDSGAQAWERYTRQDFDLGWGGVSDLLVDSGGQVWASTQGGGISLWNGQEWHSYRTSNSPLPYNTVQDVTQLSAGNFWICTSIPNETGGLVTGFDGQDWRTYKPVLTGYPGSEALAVAQDSLGRIWFGTRLDGVVIYDKP